MAYCLGSLVQILEQILHPQIWVLDHDKVPQIQSLLENASFLRDFLANSAPVIQARIESLEDRIRDAAEKAEDILESHITSKLLSSHRIIKTTKKIILSHGIIKNVEIFRSIHDSHISPPDLWEVIEVFESAKEEMIKIKDVSQRPADHDAVQRRANKSTDPNPKNIVVGVAEDLNQLRDRLTRQSTKLEIIPIVGMGGMGKTTLARILYDEFSSSKWSHFDICAWATVSQDHDVQEILLSLLGCITGKPTKEMFEQEDSGLILHKTLFGRRYLIVLDDIWSSKAWDGVQKFFPDDNQGSRVILTTRENDVADYVNSKSHVMHLISKDDSWELLRKKVFGEESCPPELEGVGEMIAYECRGLPLAVQVMGGILSQVERSIDSWEQISSNVSSSLEDAGDQFSGIFSLSYAHLPHYLKPCFLYIGAFPEDYKIRASKLVKLWVAEGFLYPIGDRSLEEAGEIYLKALVDRNLIFVRERKNNGGVKSYGIHDLLREQCLKKASEKKFLNVVSSGVNNHCMRRVIAHRWYYSGIALDMDMVGRGSLARSFICICYAYFKHLSPVFSAVSLLRVLDVLKMTFPELPEEILKLVNLRYLALCIDSALPESLSVLGNLQTLIVKIQQIWPFPEKIFDLPQLRHVNLVGIAPYISSQAVVTSYDLQENLQSLSTIPVSTLIQFLGKFPNLVKLGICGDTVDLTCFHKLETLKCSYMKKYRTGYFFFPVSLKKLTLDRCTIPQTFMNAIGALSNLEILKLRLCLLESSTWEPSEGEFRKLQYLELELSRLEDWLADETHFPQLRHLFIHGCPRLKEIPLEIGGIDTLEIIEVGIFNPSVRESAVKIINQQRDLGNNLLQLRLEKLEFF